MISIYDNYSHLLCVIFKTVWTPEMVHVGFHEVIAFIFKLFDGQREPQQIAGFRSLLVVLAVQYLFR